MVKATATFSVTGPDGRPVTYVEGDTVPDEIAAKVGAHVLDSKPDVEEENPLAGLDFENADEALKAAIEIAAKKADDQAAEIERLQGEVDELTAWRDKILSGDLSDLDLETLTAPDVTPEPVGDEPPADLYDPSEHDWRDVLKYLEGADEAEDARVRAAEKAGKNRPSIVGEGE